MSDLDKLFINVGAARSPAFSASEFGSAIAEIVRAIIADHEEQQLHEAMHGSFEQPGDVGYAELVDKAGAEHDAELITELRGRIADLERERDEARRGRGNRYIAWLAAEAEAARLRKVMESALRWMAKGEYLSGKSILTAGLQPNPATGGEGTVTESCGSDCQPTRGDDPGPVSTLLLDVDDSLPCDVYLPPATLIRKGCSIRTLLLAIGGRIGMEDMTFATSPFPDLVKARADLEAAVRELRGWFAAKTNNPMVGTILRVHAHIAAALLTLTEPTETSND